MDPGVSEDGKSVGFLWSQGGDQFEMEEARVAGCASTPAGFWDADCKQRRNARQVSHLSAVHKQLSHGCFRLLSREDLKSEIIRRMVSETCFALCARKLAEGFAEAGCLRKLLRKLRSASDAYLIPA